MGHILLLSTYLFSLVLKLKIILKAVTRILLQSGEKWVFKSGLETEHLDRRFVLFM